MTKIFITYGNDLFKDSVHRIKKEARALGLFDKIITYCPGDMPEYIKASPLKAYKRGDGYWCWKPYIIWQTMQEYPDSIIVYSDAGCTLQPKFEEWDYWFSLLEQYNTIAFQYRDVSNSDNPSNYISLINAKWTKSTVVDFFNSMLTNFKWLSQCQVHAGVILCCRNSKAIKMWLDITLLHPELVIDVYGNEEGKQSPGFIEHRHDQSLWSAISLYYQKKSQNEIIILPETSETLKDSAVISSRIKKTVVQYSRKTKVICAIKSIVGETFYNRVNKKLAKNKIANYIRVNLEHRNA